MTNQTPHPRQSVKSDTFSYMTKDTKYLELADSNRLELLNTNPSYMDRYIAPMTLKDNLQSNSEAILNIINNCLGADLLISAYATSQLGVIGSIILLTFSAYLNSKTLVLILRCCKECQTKRDYCNLAKYTFGSTGYYTVIVIYFLMGFFQMISFLVACSQSLEHLLGFELDKWQWKLMAFVFCFPTTFMRSLKKVAIMSLIANIAAIVMLVCMIWLSADKIITDGFHMSNIKLFPATYEEFATALPILVITMSIQVGGVVIMSTLADPSYHNIKSISKNAYLMIFMLYFVASFPYLAYYDKTMPNILNTFNGGVVSTVARLNCFILVVMSYMFYAFPCRNSMIDFIWGIDEAQYESTWTQFGIVTLIVNVGALTVSLAMTNLSMVFDINGTISANLIAFALPCMFYLKMKHMHKRRELVHYRNIPYFLTILFCCYTLLTGMDSVIIQIKNELRN